MHYVKDEDVEEVGQRIQEPLLRRQFTTDPLLPNPAAPGFAPEGGREDGPDRHQSVFSSDAHNMSEAPLYSREQILAAFQGFSPEEDDESSSTEEDSSDKNSSVTPDRHKRLVTFAMNLIQSEENEVIEYLQRVEDSEKIRCGKFCNACLCGWLFVFPFFVCALSNACLLVASLIRIYVLGFRKSEPEFDNLTLWWIAGMLSLAVLVASAIGAVFNVLQCFCILLGETAESQMGELVLLPVLLCLAAPLLFVGVVVVVSILRWYRPHSDLLYVVIVRVSFWQSVSLVGYVLLVLLCALGLQLVGIVRGKCSTSAGPKCLPTPALKCPCFRRPFLVYRCQKNLCEMFVSQGMGLGEQIFAGSACYCRSCWVVAQNSVLLRERGGAKFATPRMWTRFELQPSRKDLQGRLDDWHVAYHGTSASSAKAIIESDRMLMPGDTRPDGKMIEIVRGHIEAQSHAKNIFLSPSIVYISSPLYCRVSRFEDVHFLVALELAIAPSAYKIGPQTIYDSDNDEEIDSHFSNSELEWFTNRRGVIEVNALLVKPVPNRVAGLYLEDG